MSIKSIFYLFFMFLWSCSSSSDDEIKKKNAKVEYILRHHDSVYHEMTKPIKRTREPYPFEKQEASIPKITKEFFRCKGSSLHPPVKDKKDLSKLLYDCEGYRHSLAIIDGQEGVYPILIDILNHIQKKSQKRVVITSGHQCPEHNRYAQGSILSKHMIGAEVDFYVQGLEEDSDKILNLVFEFYHQNPAYNKNPEFKEFVKSSGGYGNKEIFIKIIPKNEGRDVDNRHIYPYITIQVKYDRKTHENIVFDEETMKKSILHW